jgi:hypothetical protein
MRSTYGVVWREDSLPPATGRLELRSGGLQLEGLADGCPTEHEIAYESLTDVRIGRAPDERIDGRPALVLERGAEAPIRVAAVAQSTLVSEMAERLAGLARGAERRVAVVVPLKKGAQEAVRTLLQAGPPFEPAQTDLDRHEVFLTPHEVVFVFESRLGGRALESLLAEPGLWKVAHTWRKHVAGPPRVAHDVYAWKRTPNGEPEPALLPPGLRGGEA